MHTNVLTKRYVFNVAIEIWNKLVGPKISVQNRCLKPDFQGNLKAYTEIPNI